MRRLNLVGRNFTCLAVSLIALFGCTGSAQSSITEEPLGSDIDLSQFEPSFSEEFDKLDISEWGCLSRWIAHTPWGGDFGSAAFMSPDQDSPFTTQGGILTIEARKLPNGRWGSGMLSAWDACNSGFAQKFGYFETRVRLPEAPGFWPAFWLIGVDKSAGTAEIDVFEFRTHRSDRFSLGLHKHPAEEGQKRISATTNSMVSPGQLSAGFNTFGVEIDEEFIVFYLNRSEIWRTETMPEFRQPMYPLMSFAVETGRMTEATPDSVTIEVDYIRAYQRKPIGF